MNSPIYKILNNVAREYNVQSSLNEYSSFDEVSKVFEKLLKVVDQETKRKIQFEYKLYAISAQRQNSNESYNEYSSRDLAGIINDYEIINKPLEKKEEPLNLDALMVNKSRFDERKKFRVQKEYKKKQTKKLKKLIVVLIALGIITGTSIYSVVQNESKEAIVPTSTIDVIDDTGEYNLVHYVVQPGDYSKEIIAKKLGTTPDQIEMVGDFTKVAGTTIEIKIYDRDAADNYIYNFEPTVDVSYDYHIDRGTSSLIDVASDMMSENPLLEEYYSDYEKPANRLALDLASQNKGVISSVSNFTDGDVTLTIKITEKMADDYGINSSKIVKN